MHVKLGKLIKFDNSFALQGVYNVVRDSVLFLFMVTLSFFFGINQIQLNITPLTSVICNTLKISLHI